MEQKKICPRCKKENGAEYRYCISCGTTLPVTDAPDGGTVCAPQTAGQAGGMLYQPRPEYRPRRTEPQYQPQGAAMPYMPTGIPDQKSRPRYPASQYTPEEPLTDPSEQARVFIGKNYDRISEKFISLDRRHSKVSWNWPVFFFSLCGLPFAWFFYRKLKGVGTAVLCISAALTVAVSVLIGSFNVDFIKNLVVAAKPVFEQIAAEGEKLPVPDPAADGVATDTEEKLDPRYSRPEEFLRAVIKATVKTVGEHRVKLAAVGIITLVSSVGELLLAMFADAIYKKRVEKELARYSSRGGVTPAEAASRGGTSVAAAVIPAVIVFVLPSLIMVSLLSAQAPEILSILN